MIRTIVAHIEFETAENGMASASIMVTMDMGQRPYWLGADTLYCMILPYDCMLIQAALACGDVVWSVIVNVMGGICLSR